MGRNIPILSNQCAYCKEIGHWKNACSKRLSLPVSMRNERKSYASVVSSPNVSDSPRNLQFSHDCVTVPVAEHSRVLSELARSQDRCLTVQRDYYELKMAILRINPNFDVSPRSVSVPAPVSVPVSASVSVSVPASVSVPVFESLSVVPNPNSHTLLGNS